MANIYLSVLDRHFSRIWNTEMSPGWQRQARRRKGLPNYRLVRYADDFVVLVHGTKSEAETLKTEIGELLAHERHDVGAGAACRSRERGRPREYALVMSTTERREGGESEPDGIAVVLPAGQEHRQLSVCMPIQWRPEVPRRTAMWLRLPASALHHGRRTSQEPG
ncbi:hypothetical protein [Streptomyces sp. NPDC048496]|uniref:hypothetical protein n=1 Tax=Streptomyces sp. NPDC048496 TaxID=3365558 RepID=UPI00371E48A6